jgi:putative DNA primase/helicase
VRARFVQVGRDYYFADGARAFTDRGRRLTTPSENTEVIQSLIVIAQARGWSEVTVSGTERFRKEAWSAARSAGLEVRGYQPTQFEQERMVRSVAKREGTGTSAAATASRGPEGRQSSPGTRTRDLIVGRLVDHGAAPYQHDNKGERSYFIRLETTKGERTVWGVDLERAVRESLSQPKPGDEIGLRRVRREPLTLKAHDRESEGGASYEKQVYRNRWVVETREFLAQRAEAAKTFADPQVTATTGARQHPELLGSYLQVRGAEEYAASRIRDVADQRTFVAMVRSTLAASIGNGEPLPPVRLREQTASRQEVPVRRPAERVVAPVRG